MLGSYRDSVGQNLTRHMQNIAGSVIKSTRDGVRISEKWVLELIRAHCGLMCAEFPAHTSRSVSSD